MLKQNYQFTIKKIPPQKEFTLS